MANAWADDVVPNLLDAFPAVVRYLGLLGIVFTAVVWLLTDRLEPVLLAAFGSMIGLGEAGDAVKDLAKMKDSG